MNKKEKQFTHLTRDDRIKIETLLNQGVSVKKIALVVGKCYKTIYNEIHRGLTEKKVIKSYDYIGDKTYKTEYVYTSDMGELKYKDNMSNHGGVIKLGNDYEFANYVSDKICNEHYSPSAVLAEIKNNNIYFDTNICLQTLYTYIRKNYIPYVEMSDLPCGKRKHKKQKIKARKRSITGKSIEQRPSEILDREEFGHWEMDCVCSNKETKTALLVLTERQTRKEIIVKMNSQSSSEVIKSIDELHNRFGESFSEMFKSITVDNGSEFADFERIEFDGQNKRRTTMYYCHPYCSSERGTNERMNREIRRFYPKGTDFSKVSVEDIQKLEDWLNNYPRRILGWQTANSLFEKCLEKIK